MYGYRQFVGILAEREGQTTLRVQIDEQHPPALLRHRRAQRRDRRRLGNAALLVGHRQYPRLVTVPILARSRRVPRTTARRVVRQNQSAWALHNHRLVLLRHGETEWSKSGQHTGRTDLELTEHGRAQAEARRDSVLRELQLDDPLVVSSPRIRALATAELAGLADRRGDCPARRMGLRRLRGVDDPADPRNRCPTGWSGRTAAPAARASRRSATAPTGPSRWRWSTWSRATWCSSGHGHFSRSVITRWVELPLVGGQPVLRWSAASIAVCGFEHGVRQLAALGLTGHPQPAAPGDAPNLRSRCAVATGTLVADGVHAALSATCARAQAALRSGEPQ